jgi:hypothetical protein
VDRAALLGEGEKGFIEYDVGKLITRYTINFLCIGAAHGKESLQLRVHGCMHTYIHTYIYIHTSMTGVEPARLAIQFLYSSGIQPGVRVPTGVREDILGGT